jgi:hypothetical protein
LGEGGLGRELRLGKPRFPAAKSSSLSLPTKILKTTPCKVASWSMLWATVAGLPAAALGFLHRDANGFVNVAGSKSGINAGDMGTVRAHLFDSAGGPDSASSDDRSWEPAFIQGKETGRA